jgi:hypothetical protein
MRAQQSTATPQNLGNPFMTTAASMLVLVVLAMLTVLLLAGIAGLPYLNADTTLADREWVHANCATCVGAKGAKGDTGFGTKGDKGDAGEKGQKGTTGQNAVCLPNPDFPCAKGAKGEQGIQGETGATGTGIQGPSGADGPSGPTGATGADGPAGPKGDKGDAVVGPKGDQGPPFSGNTTLENVNITGTVECDNPLPQACLGEAGCLNFTLCNITAEGVSIFGVTQAPFLKIGAPNSTLPATLQLGDVGSPYHTAVFGRRFGVTPPAYQIALFQTYATNVLIESAQFITLRSIFDINVISETGAIDFTSQSGSMTFTCVTDMYFINSGLTNVIKFTPARYFNVSTTYVDFSVGTIGNSIPGQPVRFQDSDGVSFNNTFLFNGGNDTQPLDCGIYGALILNDNVVINGNLTIRGLLYHSDNYQSCDPPMTTTFSDRRVKRDIHDVDTADSYERITKRMPIRRFHYTDDYLKSMGKVPHIRNTSYVGVIAQEVAHDFDYLISKGKATVGGLHVPDMHHIHPELLYGEMVATLQHMRKLHEGLSDRVHHLEFKASRLARKAASTGKSVIRSAVEEGKEVLDASLDTGRQALRQLGKGVEQGQAVVHSAESQVVKAISSLHSRLERLERAFLGRGGNSYGDE